MPMTVHRLSLEADKARDWPASQRVALRLGEELAARLEVEVLSGGAPMDLSGLSARVVAELADGTLAEAPCSVADAAAGLLGATLHGGFSAAPGRARRAYVELRRGQELGTTACFALEVLPSADLSAPQAKAHVSALDALEERARELAAEMEAGIASGSASVQALLNGAEVTFEAQRLDPGLDPTVTETGSGLSKHVVLGIPSATAGVSCEAGPAEVVTVHGAAEDAPVVEAAVWGETRQNLWVNPSTYSQSGVQTTRNPDGSFTISGQNTSNSNGYIFQGRESYNLKSGTYTLSVDNALDGFTISLQDYSGGSYKSTIAEIIRGSKDTVKTFSVSSDTMEVRFYIAIPPGSAPSGTYRVMLNEGDTPAPWCPPGLSSAGQDDGSVRVVARGKNLLATERAAALPLVSNGREFSDNGDGGIRVSGASESPSYYNFFTGYDGIHLPAGDYTVSCNELGITVGTFVPGSPNDSVRVASAEGGSEAFTLAEGMEARIYVFARAGADVDAVVYPQLEFGGARTGWARPFLSLSSVPLPAAHPYLASLPDGTRDELRERWDGTVELVARTHMVAVDGSSVAFAPSSSNYAIVPIEVDHDATAMAGQRVMCDAFPTIDGNGKAGCLWAGSAKGVLAFSYSAAVVSPEALNTLAKSNPIHILYKRAEESVYYYDGATWSESRPVIGSMAELRSAGDQTHVWVESRPVPAEVEAHVLLEGGKALGIEHDYVRRAVGVLAAAATL